MVPPREPFRLKLTPCAESALEQLRLADEKKWKKANKALRLLKADPRHPGLCAHKWHTLKGRAPDGGDIWTAYTENKTPGAWRLFFFYDNRERGLIYVTQLEPHS